MASNGNRFNVGGVLLSRPFKIRRLGHFGFNAVRMDESRDFYGDLLGFKHSDILDFGKMPWAPKRDDLGDTRGYFMRYGTDHHAFVLFNKKVLDHRPDRKFAPEVTVNQITWQCGSLKEIMDAHSYFQDQGVPIQRVGRDMPGSNWHVYVYDPDGHTIELYYGIEQIGWNQLSKPTEMYYRGFREKPSLPQVSEITEVAEALHQGIDVFSGNRTREALGETYDVEGVLLPRPFKITQDRPGGPVRRRRRARRGLLHGTPRLREERGDHVSRRAVRLPARGGGASQRRPLPARAPAHARALRAHDLHVVRRRGRQLHPAARGRDVPEIARREVRRLDPARALSRHRLFGVRARSRRALRPALLLHGTGRLGWRGAACRSAARRERCVARDPGTALRHLRRSGLPGALG